MELLARIGSENPPTQEELTKAREQMVALLKAALDKDESGNIVDLAAAKDIRAAIDAVDAESKRQADEAEAINAEAEALLSGLEASEEDEETEEPEAEAEAETPAEDKELAGVGASLRRAQARLSRETPNKPTNVKVLTLGAAQSESLKPDAGLRDVATVFSEAAPRVRSGRQSLVRLETQFPEDRRLFSAQREDNDRLLDAVLDAVVASGGICDPLPADFTHPILGERGRPIRDALPRFNANRGGVRYSPTATIADVTGAVGVWTHATDTSPGEAEKACLTLECEDEDVAYVDAVTACLQIGNFAARFNPEFWRSRLSLLMVLHDRIAEQKIYSTIEGGSTQVTYGAGNGSIYSILSAVDKGAAALRSRHRLGRTQIRVILPEWVRNALRADIASQRPFGLDGFDVADSRINSFFSSRGVSPIWSQDVDVFGTQNAGALVDFPGGNVDVLLFPEGTWFFLDGGTLDLGTEITDSTLNKTNDRQAFLETFEQTAKRGGESLSISVPVDEVCVCPDVAVIETSPAE